MGLGGRGLFSRACSMGCRTRVLLHARTEWGSGAGWSCEVLLTAWSHYVWDLQLRICNPRSLRVSPRDHSQISFTSSADRVWVGFAILKVCWWMPGYSSKQSIHIGCGWGIHDNRERVLTEFHGGEKLPAWVGSFQESFWWDDIERFCFIFQST